MESILVCFQFLVFLFVFVLLVFVLLSGEIPIFNAVAQRGLGYALFFHTNALCIPFWRDTNF